MSRYITILLVLSVIITLLLVPEVQGVWEPYSPVSPIYFPMLGH
jgi:hypothetical protein